MLFGGKKNKNSFKYLLGTCLIAFVVSAATLTSCKDNEVVYRESLKKCYEFNFNNEHKKAIGCFKGILETDPGRHEVLLPIAISYFRLKELDKAEQNINTFINSYPNDASGRETYCEILAEKGDFNGATQQCVFAASAEPNNPRIWVTYGSVHEKYGDLKLAISYYKTALEKDPKYEPAYTDLTLAYEKNGDINKAIETLKRLIELKPKNTPKFEEALKRLEAKRQTQNKETK